MQIGTSREASTPVWVFLPEYFSAVVFIFLCDFWFVSVVLNHVCLPHRYGGYGWGAWGPDQVWGTDQGELAHSQPCTLLCKLRYTFFSRAFFSFLFVGFLGCRVQQQHVIATLISNYFPSPPQGSLSSLQLCFSFWGRGAKWYQPRRRDFSFTKRFPVLRMNFRFWEICSMIQVFIW